MKFSVYSWDEVPTDEQIQVQKGRVQLRLSSPGALYAEAFGVKALVGYASDFNFELDEAATLTFEVPAGTRAFMHVPFATSTDVCASAEVYTNADRMPYESGMLADVTRARRMLEIERRQMMLELRGEHSKLKARIAQAQKAEAPAAEPEAAAADPVTDAGQAS